MEQGKENEDEDEEDRHVKVTKVSTGEVLEGTQAPKASELDAWLEAHPEWEVVPRELDEDGEDSNSNNAPGVVTAPAVVAPKPAENRDETPESAAIASAVAAAATTDDPAASTTVALPQVEDDEYNQSNQGSYYGMAHRVREKVTEQANILVGGQLKPYQIRVGAYIIVVFFSRSY